MRRQDLKEQIKDYFLQNPNAKLRVREIERTLDLPLPSVIRYCKELVQEEILEQVIIGSTTFYTGASTSAFRLEKQLHNIRALHESGLIEYVRFELSDPVIILFGSYAKGEDIENSDIDLYIETPSKKKIDFRKYEEILGRTIQLFTHKNIKDVTNPHLANNIINGIPLNRQVAVFL